MAFSHAIFAGLVALLVCQPALGRDLLQAPMAAPTTTATAAAGAPMAAISEFDVLNFALNLEYLEATFYQCALTGQPLPANLTGGGPAPIGCQQATNLNNVTTFLLQQLAKDEIEHVAFLRNALGGSAVPIPQIDVGPAFAAAANAAAGTTLTPAFSPYGNGLYFLHGAYIFEDVGVTAYNGGLMALTTPAFISAAARILGTEAYHAGAVRALLYANGTDPTGYGLDVYQFIDAIATLRDSADGTPEVEDAGLSTLVPANENGLTFVRTPQGVLRIVYLGGTDMGGFYPNGMNGVIKSAA